MKKALRLSFLGFACLTANLKSSGQAAFQNLDFESASVPPLPPGQYQFVPFTNAFPGWTGFFGSNQVSQALENTVSLGAHNISILGPNAIFHPIDGLYSAVIQAGVDPSGAGPVLPASIAQTGLVPSGTMSIEMEVVPDSYYALQGLIVALGGELIPMMPVLHTANYTLVAGNVAGFAGQTTQLEITASPFNTYGNYTLELDSIVFSPSPVPEPDTSRLFWAALLLLAGTRMLTRTDESQGAGCNRRNAVSPWRVKRELVSSKNRVPVELPQPAT